VGDLTPIFKLITTHWPAPVLDEEGAFAMLATLLDRDAFLGRILTGRI
jgi:GTP-binding protein